MKLTKSQEHTAYIIMLAEAEEKLLDRNFSKGLCKLYADILTYMDNIQDSLHILHRELSIIDPMYFDFRVGTIFPETLEGWKTRVKLLKQCILETY